MDYMFQNNWFGHQQDQPQVCDITTRIWCCRLSLILSVGLVLFSMIYQLWSYYMFLVRDMDDMTEAVPTIVGVVKWCNDTLAYTWPFGMCEISSEMVQCTLKKYVVPLSSLGEVTVDQSWISTVMNGCHHELFISDPDFL